MWALAVTVIVVVAFAIGLIILYAMSIGARRKAELRAVNAEHEVERQQGAIEGLEKAIERETKARTVLREKLDEAHQLVLTCGPKELPGLLTAFFASDDEAA